MTQQILLRVVNATKYYYISKEQNKFKSLFKLKHLNKDIVLKNVTVHLYRGEVLGIIGDDQSGKEMISKLMIKEVAPNLGKVTNHAQTFLADVRHKADDHQTLNEMIIRTLSLSGVEIRDITTIQRQILSFAKLSDKASKTCQDINEAEYAQLLVSIAKYMRPTVAIFTNIIQYLDESFQKKFHEFLNEQKEYDRAAVVIDDHIHSIEKMSNYLIWLTYGQVRKEGTVKEVLGHYREYHKKYNQIQDKDQKELYDLKWKMAQQELPKAQGEGYKRMRKYQYGRVPKSIEKMIFYGLTFIFGATLAALFMFIGVGSSPTEKEVTSKQVITTNSEPKYIDKSAYVLSLKHETELTPSSKSSKLKLPQYSFVDVTGENQSNYRLEVDDKTYISKKNNLYFFNPAGLYEDVDWSDLEDYVDDSYLNYIDFYNSFMHKSHKKVSETITADKANRFNEQMEGQKVHMIFDSDNQLTGFTFDMKNKAKLVKKYNISSDTWVVKSRDGFMIADLAENKWIFIQL
ncbi:ABC transporter ATP-binding protein [Mammaliicoccus sciuri]|uniref:ABC transporter ATP-binding protein n=1 Tax=Mammaliicoccus sciuri TaxID=1296 RepID=UPI001E2855CD|nr:ABC transporter ATP-binding protein [Mammaliicoccus sciuri]MCD8790013.1 ABC transporter ATP-binding protein [Mammaliicoccus sciuri]